MALFGWCFCWQGRQKEEERYVWLCGNRGCDQAAAQAPSPNKPQRRTYACFHLRFGTKHTKASMGRQPKLRPPPPNRSNAPVGAFTGPRGLRLCRCLLWRHSGNSLRFPAACGDASDIARFLARSISPSNRPCLHVMYVCTWIRLHYLHCTSEAGSVQKRAPSYGQLNLSSLLPHARTPYLHRGERCRTYVGMDGTSGARSVEHSRYCRWTP